MTAPFHNAIEEAKDELRRLQERLRAVHHDLLQTRTKATSKDRMVTVTVDAAGDVISIVFNSEKFRRVAPAELGSVLSETIRRAREQSRDQALQAFGSFLPAGLGLAGAAPGESRLDNLFENAMRAAAGLMGDEESLAGTGPGETERP